MERAELRRLALGTGCAVERGEVVFLQDADWPVQEKAAAAVRMAQTGPSPGGRGWLCVRTGGSGGEVKFARHDEETVGAAVRGFCAHFALERVNAVDVLPPHHVSGLMARARCRFTGGEHVPWSWKRLEAGETPPIRDESWVLSLVPTQLQRLLGVAATRDWLRRLRIVFIGGGPLWPELAQRAAEAGVRLSPSYGLTETAAMIAALRPEEFLAGARTSGSVMPHARVTLRPPDDAIAVAGESVFRGYWPEWSDAREVLTEDIGRIDAQGQLDIVGRRDAMILTGGKKVAPALVETALRASGQFTDVAVVGVPEPEWGEVVVACFPADPTREPDLLRAVAELAPFQRPKRFVPLADWPRTAQGKINRAELRQRVMRILSSTGAATPTLEDVEGRSADPG